MQTFKQLFKATSHYFKSCRALKPPFFLMGDYSPEDVFIVGYPRSGNTWFQHLVAGLCYGIHASETPMNVIHSVVPDVQKSRIYRRIGKQMFFKTHHLPESCYQRVVYLVRDGRDVMVSYKHYLEQRPPHTTDFKKMITEGERLFPCKWEDHIKQWQANPFGAQMLVIKYEDLLRQPSVELRRFCDFIGKDASDALIERVIGESAFDHMQEKEKWDVGLGDARWPAEGHFFRQGLIGAYQREMPADILNLFERKANEALKLYGYSLSGGQ